MTQSQGNGSWIWACHLCDVDAKKLVISYDIPLTMWLMSSTMEVNMSDALGNICFTEALN